MNVRVKRVPRLWCALQGLLPLEACLDAQRAELALPPERDSAEPVENARMTPRFPIAATTETKDRRPRGSSVDQPGRARENAWRGVRRAAAPVRTRLPDLAGC